MNNLFGGDDEWVPTSKASGKGNALQLADKKSAAKKSVTSSLFDGDSDSDDFDFEQFAPSGATVASKPKTGFSELFDDRDDEEASIVVQKPRALAPKKPAGNLFDDGDEPNSKAMAIVSSSKSSHKSRSAEDKSSKSSKDKKKDSSRDKSKSKAKEKSKKSTM